jgi:DNA-binding NtrC family response regulator
VINIKMPPLRERKEDIPLLAQYLLKEMCAEYGLPEKTLGEKSVARLLQYDWPGNVRELRNVMERAVVVSSGDEIAASDLFFHEISHQEKLIDVEKTAILDLLSKYNGNISATARALGIARTTLYRKMKALAIEPA